ncbi:GNAT family N-acetyltransferase [Rhabdobacter roseus]|uniref:Phosphinothricin acetyltransferase n=1 Tax=Rhabdobacter roseus TaxID=1655419 RepID=A0A840TXG9_9BACT|nr:GNAT family N-acetyltransferase [Rhabdobacter roseus]MBB5286302.1 phosphinothricin acetyltransferase [Rhabdobacter roseus]
MTIRFATPADTPALLAIYAPYVTESVISFEYEVPTEAEFAERVRTIQRQFPYLVAEADGRVLGYAYASVHNERTAYRWSANSSVYVQAEAHRQGVGRALYTSLFEWLGRQGYINIFAGITLPNPKSEAFHRSFGFEPIGTYANTGYKFGAWHSVAWFQRVLRPYPSQPEPPVPIGQLV